MDEPQTRLIIWEWILCLIYTSVYQARRPFGMYIVFIFGTIHLIAIFLNEYVKSTNQTRARLVLYLISFLLITTPFTFILRSLVYIIEFVHSTGDDNKPVIIHRITQSYIATIALKMALFLCWMILIFCSLLDIKLGYLITYGILITALLIILFEYVGTWMLFAISEVVVFWGIVFPLLILEKQHDAIIILVLSCIPKIISLVIENHTWIEDKVVTKSSKLTWVDHVLFSFHRILLTTIIGTLMILGTFSIYLIVVMGATESELAIHRAFNYVF